MGHSSAWSDRFSCTVQTHALPATSERPALRYHLAFLEFDEAGTPFPLTLGGRPSAAGTQLDALVKHLEDRPSNFVVAFVHGWRHDSSLGDGNVSDLRIYAAQAASIVAERCASNAQWCGTEVTAVFVAWPGARVDEARLRRTLGSVGQLIGTVAAVPTLFDRKPVSEVVAPAVHSALSELTSVLGDKRSAGRPQKMIVFGHSLGGNLLISTLRDPLLKAVRRYAPGSVIRAPVGDLVVLINPASEAANWTALQREVWARIPFTLSEGSLDEVKAGHAFFSPSQGPVLVSVTAARFWPPGGFRSAGCRFLRRRAEGTLNPNKAAVLKQIQEDNENKSRTLLQAGVNYDWATFDLFSAFRGDLRPISGSLKRWAAVRAGYRSPDNACAEPSSEAPSLGVLRELRGAGLVKTEGGGQPNATPRTRHDDSSPLRHQPRRPAGPRCERADLDDLQSAARRDRSAAGRDERPDE